MTKSNLVLSWKSFPEHSTVQLKSKLEQTICKVGTFSKFDNVFAANLQSDFLASKGPVIINGGGWGGRYF